MNNKNELDNMVSNTKNKNFRSRRAIIGICIVMAFIVYCIYLFIQILVNPTNTFIVENGKIYQEETTYGYILRDEEIVENPRSRSAKMRVIERIKWKGILWRKERQEQRKRIIVLEN